MDLAVACERCLDEKYLSESMKMLHNVYNGGNPDDYARCELLWRNVVQINDLAWFALYRGAISYQELWTVVDDYAIGFK